MIEQPGENYVVDRARERGLDEVAITNFELARIVSGNPMIVSTLDGRELCLRLATPDEVMDRQREALAEMPADTRPPAMSCSRAVGLTTPLPL